MKAALFHKAHEPVQIEEVSIDNPRDREVLVRTRATGVCHSDLHFVDGDLPAGRAGAVRVRVSFSMDADGILGITATELTTGRESTVRIEASGGLSPDEIRRLSTNY